MILHHQNPERTSHVVQCMQTSKTWKPCIFRGPDWWDVVRIHRRHLQKCLGVRGHHQHLVVVWMLRPSARDGWSSGNRRNEVNNGAGRHDAINRRLQVTVVTIGLAALVPDTRRVSATYRNSLLALVLLMFHYLFLQVVSLAYYCFCVLSVQVPIRRGHRPWRIAG